MSSKPETTFIGSVHRHLRDVYAEKMNNPFRRGTADVWYSGEKGDLWIEYKYVPKPPKRADLLADLSAPQITWLADRHREGRRVAVIVGCPAGGLLLLDRAWEAPVPPRVFAENLRTREELAEWIRSLTGPSPCLFRELSSPLPTSCTRRIGSWRQRSSSGC